jgi:parallel beta-helix repeat protein
MNKPSVDVAALLNRCKNADEKIRSLDVLLRNREITKLEYNLFIKGIFQTFDEKEKNNISKLKFSLPKSNFNFSSAPKHAIITLAFTVVFIGLFLAIQNPAITGYTVIDPMNSNFSFMRNFCINNTGAFTWTENYTAWIIINTTDLTRFQKDGDDIAIASNVSGTNIEIDRRIYQNNTENTFIFFKTNRSIAPGVKDCNYNLFYDDQTRTNPPENGSRVFLFFDDFERFANGEDLNGSNGYNLTGAGTGTGEAFDAQTGSNGFRGTKVAVCTGGGGEWGKCWKDMNTFSRDGNYSFGGFFQQSTGDNRLNIMIRNEDASNTANAYMLQYLGTSLTFNTNGLSGEKSVTVPGIIPGAWYFAQVAAFEDDLYAEYWNLTNRGERFINDSVINTVNDEIASPWGVGSLEFGTMAMDDIWIREFYGGQPDEGLNYSLAAEVDIAPPVISNVTAYNITNQSAIINWTTDELSNSTVNYNVTLALGIFASNSSFVIDHSINLYNLSNNTKYFYNVSSCDQSGNCKTNGTFNFTTSQNCLDADFDGFNDSSSCGLVDCNDANANILPPAENLSLNRSITFCPGTFNMVFGVRINSSNIIVSCNQTVINGTLSNTGINITNLVNVTVRQCSFLTFSSNIFLGNVSGSTIFNNTALSASSIGISLTSSVSNTISNNNASLNVVGVRLITSSNNTVSNNSILAATVNGITVATSSENNALENNLISGGSGNGIGLDSSINNFLFNNNISSGFANAVRISTSSNNNTIANNKLISGSTNGIRIDASFNNTLSNNSFAGNTIDIFTSDAANNTLILLTGQNRLLFDRKFINVTDIDNLFINSSIAAVNSTAEPRMNQTANISFAVTTCGVSLFTFRNFTTTIEATQGNRTQCTTCSGIVCSNNIMNFTTSSFSTIVAAYPTIVTISPNATNQTQNITSTDNNITINVTIGTNITFNVTAEDATSSFLTFRWFVDGVLAFTETVASFVTNLFRSVFSFVFNVSGIHNITVVVNNSFDNDTFTFAANVTCVDADRDGFNATPTDIGITGCGVLSDCNDNDANILPPSNNATINRSITFCPGTFNVTVPIRVVINETTVTCNQTVAIGNSTTRFMDIIGVNGTRIVGCTLGNYSVGFNVSRALNDHAFINNTVANASNPFRIAGVNYTIKGNRVERLIGGAGAIANFAAVANSSFIENTFDTMSNAIVFSTSADNKRNVYANNTFSNLTGTAIVLVTNGSDIFSGNNFTIVSSGVSVTAGTSNNSVFTNNVFVRVTTAISPIVGATPANNIVYMNNTMINVTTAFSIRGNNYTITGNILENVTTGFGSGPVTNSTFVSNMFTNVVNPITLTNTQTIGNTVENNTVINATIAIQLTGTGNNRYAENNLTGGRIGIFESGSSANSSVFFSNVISGFNVSIFVGPTAASNHLQIIGNTLRDGVIGINFTAPAMETNHTIANNVLNNFSIAGISRARFTSNASTIANNTIANYTSRGIIFVTLTAGGNNLGVLIENNTIIGASSSQTAIVYAGPGTSIGSHFIRNNDIACVSGEGINITAGAAVTNLTISNNRFVNCEMGIRIPGTVTTTTLFDSIISENVINRSTIAGIIFNSGTLRNIIRNNTFVDNFVDINTTGGATNDFITQSAGNTLSYFAKAITIKNLSLNFFVNNSLIAVNSSAETAMNTSANVSFIVPSCAFSLVVNPTFTRDLQTAISGARNCTTCSGKTCSDNLMNFTTSSFSTIVATSVPNITLIFPNATNQTQPISERDTNVTINVSEGTNVTFNVTVEDLDSDVLTFRWFVNGILQFVDTVTNLVGNLFTSVFSFLLTQGGINNVTVVVNDSTAFNDTFIFRANVTCADADGDGATATNCSNFVDCNDNDASVVSPFNNMQINRSVVLCPGNFSISTGIKINVSNVVVTCNNTFINGTGSASTADGFNVTGVPNVTIVGCNIRNYKTGITVRNSPNATIRDNLIFSIADNGILAVNSNNANITGNNVTNAGNAFNEALIFTDNSSFMTISNNVVSNTTASNGADGIVLNTQTRNSTVSNNTIFVSSTGITGSEVNDSLIINNTLINVATGIQFSPSRRNVFSGNNFTNLSSSGMDFQSIGDSMVNNVFRSLRIALNLNNANSTTISNNTISNAADDGISLSTSNSNHVSGNILINSSASGTAGAFRLTSSSNNTFVNNEIINSTTGIFLSDSSNNTFNNNAYTGNGADIVTEVGPGNNTLIILSGSNQLKYERKFLNVSDVSSNLFVGTRIVAVNASAEPQMNVTAEVTFTDLDDPSTPTIFMLSEFTTSADTVTGAAVVCPNAICTNVTYSSGTGTLTFNITSFSSFAVPVFSAPAEEEEAAAEERRNNFVACTANYACTEWSECVDGAQTRTCTDQTRCYGPRSETQECEIPVEEKPEVVIPEAEVKMPIINIKIIGSLIGLLVLTLFIVSLLIRKEIHYHPALKKLHIVPKLRPKKEIPYEIPKHLPVAATDKQREERLNELLVQTRVRLRLHDFDRAAIFYSRFNEEYIAASKELQEQFKHIDEELRRELKRRL